METAAPSVDDGQSDLSLTEASALFLAGLEAPEDESENLPADGADQATAEQESPSQEDDTDPEQALGETQDEDTEDENLPPIERPRSWSKDDDDDWNALPRARQEKIAANERAREADINRRINEAAEKLKGLTAKEQAAEQARTDYETKVKAALNVLEREQLSQFPDIRTTADVTNLAQTDPLRYLQWKAHQDELAWTKAEADKAEGRTAEAKSHEWNTFRAKENALAIEHIPDLGDKTKAPKLMENAVNLLQDVGFTPEELVKYDGGEKLSLFDHRVQRIVFDALRYRAVQAAKTAALTKPVPQVQRPSTRPAANASRDVNLQALSTRLTNSGSVDDAWALYEAQLNSGNRRRAS